MNKTAIFQQHDSWRGQRRLGGPQGVYIAVQVQRHAELGSVRFESEVTGSEGPRRRVVGDHGSDDGSSSLGRSERPANKPDAVNLAIASRLHSGRHWRGVTDPERSENITVNPSPKKAAFDSIPLSRLPFYGK